MVVQCDHYPTKREGCVTSPPRKTYCRYLKQRGQQCTGEALNPESDIELCMVHTIAAVQSMRLTYEQLAEVAGPAPGLFVAPAVAERHKVAAEIDHVYYVRRYGEIDRIKIGYTRDLARRIKVLDPDEVMAIEPGGLAVERERHHQFRHLLVRDNEWFRAAPVLLAHIADVRRMHGPPPVKLTALVRRRRPIAPSMAEREA